MHLKRLFLRNFRSYKQAEVHFSPSINLIQGENGQGKTNLLEAIHLLSTGRSFRASSLSDLIHFGESFFYLEAHFQKEGVSQELKVYYDETTRKIQYNQTVYSTLTSLLGILPSVLLSPDDHGLISGNPAERRRFLDLHIAQTDPLYIHHLGRYFKAMKQRNHLLRSKREDAIDAWEQMMAQSAAYLIHKRKEAANILHSPACAWMQILSCSQDLIEIQYQSSLPTQLSDSASHFQQIWKKNRTREFHIGSTQLGPHRDDLSILLAQKEAKTFSSEGQKRSCITALRFAQWKQIAQELGSPPLLGIDDFGIQLDKERQTQLKNHLSQFSQVFLTSPLSLNPFFQERGDSIAIFTIKRGMVNII